MENSVLQYNQVVNLVIAKYASYLTPEDKEDLKNEAYLALLEAGEKILGPGFAYKVARNRVCSMLRRDSKHRKTLALDPDFVLQSEIKEVDHAEIVQILDSLDVIDCYIIKAFFGIECEKKTEKQIADSLSKSKRWVQKRKHNIIKGLKEKWVQH